MLQECALNNRSTGKPASIKFLLTKKYRDLALCLTSFYFCRSGGRFTNKLRYTACPGVDDWCVATPQKIRRKENHSNSSNSKGFADAEKDSKGPRKSNKIPGRDEDLSTRFSNGSLGTSSSQVTCHSALLPAKTKWESCSNNKDATRSASESVRIPGSTVTGERRRKFPKRHRLPECQQFQDTNVIQWLKNKEEEKKEASRKKRAEERARREAETTAEEERKKRAELALEAYNAWLLKKTRDLDSRKAGSERNAPAGSKAPPSTAPVQQGDNANIPSDKLVKADYFEYDTSETSNGIRLKTEINHNMEKDARSSQVRQLTQKQTQASSVQSTPLIKLPEGSIEPFSSSNVPFNEDQDPANSELIHLNEFGEKPQAEEKHTSWLKMDHTEWMKQTLYEAELVRKAREKACQRLALEKRDQNLSGSWRELIRERYAELEKPLRFKHGNQLANSSKKGGSKKMIGHSKRSHTSLSESDAVSTTSLSSEANKFVARRRRFSLKLPVQEPLAVAHHRPHTAYECLDYQCNTPLEQDIFLTNVVKETVVKLCDKARKETTSKWAHSESEFTFT